VSHEMSYLFNGYALFGSHTILNEDR
jgi:hypothetical protein